METYDVIAIGLGAMGSATVYQLAKKGVKVLGIEQFAPGHSFGSSHGETRITRQAIAEGKEYVPLVLRANELWREIEQEASIELYVRTGILILASNATEKPNKFVDNTIAAANEYGIEHRELHGSEMKAEFGQFNLRGDEKGYYEPGAGFLRAEECVQTQLQLARKYGAILHYSEKFLGYNQEADGIVVTTDKGIYRAKKLIFTVGPWVRDVLPQNYTDTVKIYRQVLYWFKISGEPSQFSVGNFPVFNWEFNTAHEDFIYGFPSLDGQSVKVATEQYDITTSPTEVDRTVKQEEIDKMYEEYIQPHFPELGRECLRAQACLYSLAPDWRFLIDRHPENENVLIASPCSGHGFKHSVAIGEILADMAQGSKTKVDITSFSFNNLHS